jgi:hypothetical protein
MDKKVLYRAISQVNIKVIEQKLENIENNGLEILFTVLGNTDNIYNVKFTLSNDENAHVICSCPHYKTKKCVCKHICHIYLKIFHLIPTNVSFNLKIEKLQSQLLINNYNSFINKSSILSLSRNTCDDECPVCFEKLGICENYICYQCRNSIHNDCINQVKLYNNICPLCRAKLL